MAQMIILPFIPIMALICQNILSLMSVLEYQNEVTNIDKQVQSVVVVVVVVVVVEIRGNMINYKLQH